MGRFYWNPSVHEQDNYVNLDVEHAATYFATDAKGNQPLLDFLKE